MSNIPTVSELMDMIKSKNPEFIRRHNYRICSRILSDLIKGEISYPLNYAELNRRYGQEDRYAIQLLAILSNYNYWY